MNKPKLLFKLILQDGVEKSFSLYDNNFTFDYGFGRSLTELSNEMSIQASIRIEGIENLIIVENFIFSNYKELVNQNNIKEMQFEIYRENSPNCNQVFNFQKEIFSDLNIYYTNNSNGESRFILSFKLHAPLDDPESFKGILVNG